MTMWGRWARAEAWLIMSIPETFNHAAAPCCACKRSRTAGDDEDADRHTAAKCFELLPNLKGKLSRGRQRQTKHAVPDGGMTSTQGVKHQQHLRV